MTSSPDDPAARLPPPPAVRPVVDLVGMLATQAAKLGDRPFLKTGDTDTGRSTISWQEMEDLVAAVAGGLREQIHGLADPLGGGNGSGNGIASRYSTAGRVMTFGGDAAAQIAVWFACQRLGLVWVPINPLLTGRALEQIVATARPDVIVAAGNRRISKASPEPLEITDLTEGPSLAAPDTPLDQRLWAKLMFTSGTTGRPKGVVWSRRCEAVWAEAYGTELLDVAEGEHLFTCLPLAHVTAQGTVISALRMGATVTVAPGFSPFSFWDQVRAAEARRFTYVGTILATLAKRKPSAADRDHNLDRIVGAGAPIGQWRAIEDRFGVQIVETWGQTESAGCYTRPDSLPQRPGSIGAVPDRFEVTLAAGPVGEGTVSTGETTDGELLIRPTKSGAIFDGYLRSDGGVESPYDTDGWYHTGDRMRFGDDGQLEFIVRERESIRRRGEIIAASPIEEAATAHERVLEAAAVPVTSDDGVDQEIKLCVVCGERAPEAAELHRFLRGTLPRFMVPRYIQFFDSFPKTGSTRIQKFKLDHGTDGAWDARHRGRQIR